MQSYDVATYRYEKLFLIAQSHVDHMMGLKVIDKLMKVVDQNVINTVLVRSRSCMFSLTGT